MSQAELSRRIGITPSTISRWLTGNRGVEYIRPVHWRKLQPLLEPYLPAEYRSRRISPELSTVPAGALTSVPVLGMAAAAGYDPILEPLDDYIAGQGSGTASFADAPPGSFALRVEGDSMQPLFPPGTLLLVGAGQFPKRGQYVVARLADGSVIVKRYQRKENVITLEALNHGTEGRDFVIRIKEEPGRIIWMWPVLAWSVKAPEGE